MLPRLILAVFLVALKPTESYVDLDVIDATTSFKFSSAISTILSRHFAHSHEAVLINREFNGTKNGLRQLDLLNKVVRLIDGKLMVQFQSKLRDELVRPWYFNWFMIDGYESFMRIFENMDYTMYEFSGYYLVTIVGEVTEELSSLIRKILVRMWSLDIFNVNVAIEDATGETLIYTFFPYSEAHCGVVNPVLWHTFSSNSLVDLYPDRLSTFHGCPLIGGTLEAKPYTIFRRQKNVKEVVVSGFEGDLMNLLAAKQNFTLRYKISPAAWGFARELGKSTGVMKMIQEEEVDFGVGCMAVAQDRSYWLKPGITHYTSKVLFAVPAGRPFTAFEKIFRPFQMEIWFLIMLCVTIGVFVIGILQCRSRKIQTFVYGNGNTSPALNMINIFYGGTLPHPPAWNFARTILLLWILLCFVIRTLYQGSLFQYLQRAMNHKPLETMDEIHRSGVQYYMMEIGQRYFMTMPHVLERTTYITPGKDALGNMVERIGAGKVYGVVLIPLDHAAYHNKIFPQSQFVQIAKEHVAVYPVALYYPKKSRLTKVFDDRIRNIQPTGLIRFWMKRYGDYEFFKKMKSSREPRQLSNQHLAGGYQLFIGWLVVSVVVFVLELLSLYLAAFRSLFLFFID